MLTHGHPEHLDDLVDGYGAALDLDVTCGWWSVRSLLAARWEPAERIGGPVWGYDKSLFYGETTELGPQHDELRRRITGYL